MEKILVTGGTGLVGNGIQNFLINNNFDNYQFIFMSRKDCNLLDYKETFNFINYHKPTYIIHLAADVGGLFKNIYFQTEMFENNLLMNYNVLKCSHLNDVKRVLCCLSTCIFPDKTSYPINEEMLHDGPPHDSNFGYAHAKRMLEIQCRTYQQQHNRDYFCVIPTNIYGPNDNFNLWNAHVIPSLIHKCYLSKEKNEDFMVCGTGKPLRQFIFNLDLGKLMIWCLFNYNGKTPIILSVSPEQEVSIEYVSRLIAKKFNYEHKLIFDTTKSDGQYKKTADNSKLMNLLQNDFNFTSIEDGLNNTIDWFIENYYTCRK